jgi:protein SCO1
MPDKAYTKAVRKQRSLLPDPFGIIEIHSGMQHMANWTEFPARHVSWHIAPVLTISAFLLATAFLGPASAHQGKGQVVHESQRAVPDPTYQPPAPETLGGPFELTDFNGGTVTDATFRGKWALYFFGFVGCREACPLGLDKMTLALQELGETGEKIQPIFVDIDFAEPDPKGLKQFLSHFHPRLIGLTGNRKQVFHVLRGFKVRRDMGHNGYGKKETGPRIDHSTHFYLVDPQGRTKAYFYHNLTPAEMVAFLRRHIEGTAAVDN